MQKWEWALLLGMVGTVCCSALAGTAQSYGSLEQNVLRLHILANSDSIDDQALKLKVRDKVLAQTENLFQSQPENAADAEQLVAEHLETLEQWIMPAGDYEALRITIGEAAGQNWWCVMYPSLCVPNACEVTADEETAQEAFGKSEQDMLQHHERYAVKLKCVEWLKQWF